MQGRQSIDSDLGHQFLGEGVGQQRCHRVGRFADRRSVGLHTDGVDDRVRSAPVGERADLGDQLVPVGERDDVEAVVPGAVEAFRHEIDGDDSVGAAVSRDPAGHVADRPEAEHRDAAAGRNRRVLDGLPRCRQDVGEVDEAIIDGAGGNLDRPVSGVRNTQILSLSTSHGPVELRVAEQRRARPVLSDLGRLTLRLQASVAHEARPARDLEGHDDPITWVQTVDLAPHLLDDSHRLMPEHIALAHERSKDLVQVQIGTTQTGRRHLDDGVRRLLDDRVGNGVHPDVPLAMPDCCSHRRLPVSWRASPQMRSSMRRACRSRLSPERISWQSSLST